MQVVVYITEYKRGLKAKGYAAATIESYTSNINQFAQYLDTNKIEDIRQITPTVITDYHASVHAKSLSPETKALRLRSVKRFFEQLEDTGKLLLNPTDGIREISRKNKPGGPVMTQQQVQTLLAAPNLSLRLGIRDRAVMEVFYATAIRADELVGLTVYDADLTQQLLYIRKGKGKHQRVTPLGHSATSYLKEYLHKIRPRYAKKNPRQRALFLNQYGQPVTYQGLVKMVYKHKTAAGIKTPVSLHTFRRSCATHMLQNGAGIRHIQQLLGHKNLATTALYTKVVPMDLKQIHTTTHP